MQKLLLAALLLMIASRAQATPACSDITFENATFTRCVANPQTEDFRLMVKNPDGSAIRTFRHLAKTLGPDSTRVIFAMNAGMFDRSGDPIGLYVERGLTEHPLNTATGSGNFYLKPNGVFSVDSDGTAHVETTEAFSARHASPFWATQSGPMLLIDGALNPNIAEDGLSENVRNAVGVCSPDTISFVISDQIVSFGKLARFFRDKLGCHNALYLDGDISAVWIPSEDRKTQLVHLGPMAVVLAKAR